MFQTKCDTAKLASEKFQTLMQKKPKCWAENMIESVKDLRDEDEQMLFLQWCADPSGSTKAHLKKPKTIETKNKEYFENCKDFEIQNVVGTDVKTTFVKYSVGKSQDDEKCE